MIEKLSAEGGSTFGGKIKRLKRLRVKFLNPSILQSFNSRSGQSLAEVVIGLAIGAVLIGTAAFAISTMLRANLTTQRSGAASSLAQGLMDKTRSFAEANWAALYGLAKGSGTTYFLNASSSTFFVVQGQEGVLDNDVTNGLVGEWKFDEDAASTSTITYNAIADGRIGTLSMGSTATSVPQRAAGSSCKVSNCLLFNGQATSSGNYVLAPYSTSIDISGSGIALSAWIYLLGYPASGQSAGIIRHNGYSYGYRLLVSATNKAYLQLTGINGYSLTSAVILPLNQWTHIVGVLDNGTMKIYINSVQDPNTKNRPGNVDPGSEGVYLGQTTEYSSLNGYLDDIRIYNRALTADEVNRLYNSGVFKRWFSIENVCRSNDASSTITGTAPCGGNTLEDASTEKVTVTTQWSTPMGVGELKLATFLTRWRNSVFQQTDWSGGTASEGAIPEPTAKFASSTNINYASTTGSIQIQNLSQQQP